MAKDSDRLCRAIARGTAALFLVSLAVASRADMMVNIDVPLPNPAQIGPNNDPITDFDVHASFDSKSNVAPPKVKVDPDEAVDGVNLEGGVASDPQFMPPTLAVENDAVASENVDGTFSRGGSVEAVWDAANGTIDSGADGMLHFGLVLEGQVTGVKLTSIFWTTDDPQVTQPVKGKATVGFERLSATSFSFSNDESESIILGGMTFEARETALSLSALDPSGSLGGTNLDPDQVLINDISTPIASTYTLASGDTIEFVFAASFPEFMTVQGLGTYAGGDEMAFAYQESQVPEPSASALLLFGLAAFAIRSSPKRMGLRS